VQAGYSHLPGLIGATHQLLLLCFAACCCTAGQVQGPQVHLQAQAAATDRPVSMHGSSVSHWPLHDGCQSAGVSKLKATQRKTAKQSMSSGGFLDTLLMLSRACWCCSTGGAFSVIKQKQLQ
jgi:hypothetical protein